MNSLRLYWLLALLVAWLPGAAQQVPAQFEWVRTAHYPATTVGNDVYLGNQVTDAAGNTYASLSYPGSVILDGTAYNGTNTSEHAALVKFDANGHVLWFKQMGNELDSTLWAPGLLTLDPVGNIHALMSGQVHQRGTPRTIEGLPVATGGWTSTYAASWTPQGVIQSAALLCHGGADAGTVNVMGMAAAANGDAIISGNYMVQAQFDTVLLTQDNPLPGRTDGYPIGFIARFAPSGQLRWVHEMIDTDTAALTTVLGVQLDAAGNTYVMGGYSGRTGLGGFAFTPTAGAGIQGGRFWAKVSPAGRVLGARSYDIGSIGPLGSHGRIAFRVRPDGYAFASWSITEPSTLMPGLTVTPTGHEDLLITAYDPNGVVQWAQLAGGTDQATTVLPFDIELKGDTRLYVSAFYRGEITTNGIHLPLFNNPVSTTQQGTVMAFNQENGRGIWALPTMMSSGRRAHWLSMSPGGLVLSMLIRSDTVRLGNLLALVSRSVSSNSVLTRITERYNTLSGAAYVDANANGVQDAAEGGFPGGLIVEVGPDNIPCAAPEATGRYDAYVDLGSYSASLPYPPAHYTIVAQGPAATAFSTYGNVAAGRSFALRPIANQQDVQVVLTLNSLARPGFPAVYDVQYRNVGTVALAAGAVTLTLDSRLNYQRSMPTGSSGSGALTWTYANLQPGEMRRIRVECTLANTAVLGSVLTSVAQVTPLAGDLEPADNESVAERIISGSFDPNDIQVNHVQLSTAQVVNGEWLEYTIRFQNHGSDTAFSVLVRDSLAANLLRRNTIQLLAASHSCGWSISPTGVVLVSFPDIRLPPQSTNIYAADGFVRFRIRPVASLLVGDEIPNQAVIHFDYNEPFPTNTALTIIGSALGAPTTDRSDLAVTVWPNPASGTLHVEATRPQSGTFTLTLFDALGRAVRTQAATVAANELSRTTLDVSGLPGGVYTLRGQGAGQPLARRVVVR